MAHYIPNGSAADSSNSANYDTVTNTPTIHASTNISVVTGGTFTATFTAPNTTNKSTGCAFLMIGASTQNWTATLYESGSAVASTATTITSANLPTISGSTASWVYFRWATPYQYTTTTAGAYKVQIKSVTSNSGTVAADSGAANPVYLHTDDRHTLPGVGDDVYTCGLNALTTPNTLTITGTSNSWGDGADTTAPGTTSFRSIGSALQIGAGGTVNYDTSASATLQIRGHLQIGANGEYDMGTVASPYPNGKVATLKFDQNGTSGNFGIFLWNGGKRILQGTPTFSSPTTNWKTKYVSGTGATGSEMVVADGVGWALNDEIIVLASSNNATNYNEAEVMFIQNVVNSTTYALSTSSGGANTALSFTHNTNAHIINVQRNVVVTTTNTAQAFYTWSSNLTQANDAIKWIRIEQAGMSTANKQGWYIQGPSTSSTQSQVDYSVCKNTLYRGWYFPNGGAINQTHTGLVSYSSNSGSGVGAMIINCPNKTLNDFFIVKCNQYGLEFNAASNITMNRTVVNACSTANASTSGIIVNASCAGVNLYNLEVNCNRTNGIIVGGGASILLSSPQLGSYGFNTTNDLSCNTNSFNTWTLLNPTCSSPTTITNYGTMAQGSSVTFSNLNGTNYNNYTYSPVGVAQTTGAALSDTNVRTANTYNYRIASTDTTNGYVYSYYKGVPVGQALSALGFIQLNAAFTGDAGASCVVNMYLPGNTLPGATPDAAYIIPKTTNSYQPYVLAANYLGSINGVGRIDIVVKTTTASAYAYIADLDNGSNQFTNFTTWSNGLPTDIMPETLGDAVAMWSTATSALTASGSIGELLSDALTFSQFMATK